MSYDVWLEIDTGGEEPYAIDFGHNITYNYSRMYYEAGLSVRDLDLNPATHGIKEIQKALKLLKAEPERFRALQPKNAEFGTYDEAVEVLEALAASFIRHPKTVIMVS